MTDTSLPLCDALRAVIVHRVVTLEHRCSDFEGRVRALEKYQSEQVGLNRGQATMWGLAIGVISVIISTLVQFYIGGMLP